MAAGNGSSVSTGTLDIFYLPIVAEDAQGCLALYLIDVLSTDSGSVVMWKSKRRLLKTKTIGASLKRALRCQQLVVEIADVALVGALLHYV
jgi:hypothetical protein